jgi:multidrug resistance efflux pump
MKHFEDAEMKYVVILFCLVVCYVSLPVTIQSVADAQTVAEQPDPAAAEPEKKESSDAEQNGAATKPAAEEVAAKNKDETTEAKPEAKAKAKEEKKDEKPKRKTAKVEAKPMKVVVTLDGTFTAEKMTPVALRPETWSQYEIVEVVKHGTEVHEGEVLVKFDEEKIDQEIADLELDLHQSELAIRKAEQELPRAEKSLAMAATDAAQLDQNARDDYDRYFKIDRPMVLKSIEYSLKSAQFQLDYQQDELDQLEKMYEADDLTEETEEIVLKRSRTSVDFAKFNLEQTKLYCDELLQVRLPRFDVDIKEAVDKAGLELARAKTALAVDLVRARYDLEEQKQTRAKSLERLAKLMTDRGLMELKAPADGIVYYGDCDDNGNWSDVASLISKLKPHYSVSPDTVVMTVVERRPLDVLAEVGEDKRADFSVGQPARVVPPLESAAWLPAKLASISSVPVATGRFASDFDLTGSELPDWIVPGMSCKVKVVTYDKEKVLTVPKKAVQTDKLDEEQKYIWLVDSTDAKAKPVRRDVKLGRSSGDDVEVLSGLKKDDVVSLEDESKKDDDAAAKE